MAIVTIHEAKTNLSKLIARAQKGEEIVIAKGKEPVVRLTSVHQKTGKRGLAGLKKGKWPAAPDEFFFAPLPEEELELWERGD